MLQAAVNAGGVVSLSGTCALGPTAIGIGKKVTITGPAQLNSTGSYAFIIWSDNVSISGITFNRAGVHLIELPHQSNFTFTSNHIQNTNGNDGIDVDGVLRTSTINNNSFTYIAPDGFETASFESLGFGACYSNGSCDSSGVGIQIYGGMDQTSIDGNSFDLIANDAMHIGWNIVAADADYLLTKNNDISYNTFTRVHRIGIEAQAIWSWPYCGLSGAANTCDMSHNFSTNTTVKGNYFHDPFLTYTETFAYSLAIWGDGQYINNAGIANTTNGQTPAYGIEDMGNNVLTQGNVIASDYIVTANPHGWSSALIYGAQQQGSTFTTQNNVLCGDQDTSTSFGIEPNSNGAKVNSYNYVSNSCPNAGALTQSAISIAFVSPESSVATGLWKVAITSALPIRNVQFFADGGTNPVFTQELQDVSTTFAVDRQWRYHASLAPGVNHTISATATDIAGATQSITYTSALPPPAAPKIQIAPQSIAFGTHPIGRATAPAAVVVSNIGNSSLVISSVGLTGPNMRDFRFTTTCGMAVTAGGSCTVSTVFTASTGGLEGATLSLVDNASGSPHTIALMGTGAPAVIEQSAVLKAGVYNIQTVGTAIANETMDLGWGLHPEWGNYGSYVYLFTYNNGPSQQLIYTGSGQLQSVQSPGEYLYDKGGALAIGPVGDIFVISASGSGYAIKDKNDGGLYVKAAGAIAPPNKLSLSAAPTVWKFNAVLTGLATGKSYNFRDAYGNTMDLGWALHPDWGNNGPYIYLYSYNNGPSQQLTFTAAGQLQAVQNTQQYLYSKAGALAVGPVGDTFTISQSGSGFVIHDNTANLYVNSSGALLPPNQLRLSSTPTVWQATPQ